MHCVENAVGALASSIQRQFRCGLRKQTGLALLMGLSQIAFAGAGIDASTFKDAGTASKTITSPAFTTTSGNELLLAFVATDAPSGSNTVVNSISGAGLTWVLVIRTNVQKGTSEIWRAFSPSPLSGVSVTATL